MPINPNIALQVKQPEIESPLNALAQASQVKNAMNQNRLFDMQVAENERKQARQNALMQATRNAFDPTTNRIIPDKYRGALAEMGDYEGMQAFDKSQAEQDKVATEIDAKKFDVATKRYDYYKKTIGALAQEPGLNKEMAAMAGQALVQANILDAAAYDKYVQEIPDDPAQLRAKLMQAVKSQLTPEQMLTAFAPKAEKIDNGQRIEFRDMNPNSPTYGQVTGGGAVQKMQSPDSVASVGATIRGQNLTDARAREANASGKVPAGYRANPDGSMSYIPGGPADPSSAGSGKPLTENQGKAVALGMRAIQAEETVKGLDASGFDSLNLKDRAAAAVPLDFGRGAMSDQAQQYENAQRNFISAVLRKESGAAISTQEFENERKKYFPQVSDGASVRAQKAQQRALAIEGLKAEAGQQGVRSMTGAPIKRAGESPSGPAIPSGWSVKEH